MSDECQPYLLCTTYYSLLTTCYLLLPLDEVQRSQAYHRHQPMVWCGGVWWCGSVVVWWCGGVVWCSGHTYRPNRYIPQPPTSHAHPMHPSPAPNSPAPASGPLPHLLPSLPPAQALLHPRRPSARPPEANDDKRESYCPNRYMPHPHASYSRLIHPGPTPASPA